MYTIVSLSNQLFLDTLFPDQILATVNIASINTGAQMSFVNRYMPRSEIADSYRRSMGVFQKSPYYFPKQQN